MGRLHTSAHATDTSPDVSQTVPGWRSLLEQIEQKDQRIDELESKVRRLREEVVRLRGDAAANNAPDADGGSSRAAELVEALRRTDESAD